MISENEKLKVEEILKIEGEKVVTSGNREMYLSNGFVLYHESLLIDFSNFKVHSFELGKEPRSAQRVHDLLLVGLDVYFYEPSKTIKILDSLGYCTSKIHEDVFDGRKVYVVGADKGDLEIKQFWIDAERLYMHRIIYDQKGKINDVIFSDYTKMETYWMSKTIIFKTNGKLGLIERYYDIKFPKEINQDWFDAKKFNEVVLD